MNARSAVCWCLWLSLLVAAVENPSVVQAQGNSVTISVFPPAPRSLRQNLVRAKKAIEEGRFSDAVSEIGVVLTGKSPDGVVVDDSQDFFVEVAGQPGMQTSIKAEAQRLLGTLPPKGRELFELQFGADARALFEEAVQSSDVNRLNEVIRQYFHTKAGYEAAVLLGRLHLDHGRPLAAALCLQRVAAVPSAAAPFEPELSLLLAACWQLSQQPEQARQTLASLPPRFPRGQIRLGDTEVNELPTAEKTVSWLTEHFRSVAATESDSQQWTLFRGSPSRNASRSGGVPLRRSRWQVPLVVDDHDRAMIEDLRTGFVEQGSPMLPVVQPLAVGNFVVLRSSERLVGIDFKSGKRVWEYPFDISQEEETTQQLPTSIPPQNTRDGRMAALRERLWQDVPYGQVSSDGNSVYLLDGVKQTAQWNQRMRINRVPGMRFALGEPMILQNELVALDLQREGYLLWRVGAESGGDEPKLAGVYFLGPPLPLFGNLYSIAELKGELRLIVLDAATGKQQWSQQLAHMEAMIGMDEQARRYSGATPSFADGVLVCPTSAGAVVAVDVATRTLLWGYQYSSSSRDSFGRNGLIQPLSLQTSFSANRWQDAAVTIAEGSVLITPVEHDALICLDLLTGKPRWAPLPRTGDLGDMLYVAGVHEGAAILVGKNRVTAINLKDGKPAWKDALRLSHVDSEMPSGRGFLSDHFYYLPTTKSQLLKIDLRTGQIAERTVTDHVLGNVVCFRDEIISVAADRAATFFQIEPLRKTVTERLAKSPDDAWALARQGELLVHDGKTAEALDVLRKAHQRDSRDAGVRSLLVDTYLSSLSEDFAKHSGLAAEMEPLIDSEAQKAKYLMLAATGHQKAGNQLGAAEYFVKFAYLSAANAKKLQLKEAFPLVSPEKDWTVRTDRFLSARLEELYRGGDSTVQERIDGLVSELSKPLANGSTTDFQRFLQLCGFHPASREVRIQFANRLIEAGEYLDAELTLAPLLADKDAQFSGGAWALYAKMYALAKKPSLAADASRRLLQDWGDVAVLNGKTGRELAQEAASSAGSSGAAEWPWGLVGVTESHDAVRNTMYGGQQFSFSILQRRGMALENLKLVFESTPSSNPYLRDGNGAPVFRLPSVEMRPRFEPGLWQTAADGHLLFSYFNGSLTAVNTLQTRPNESETLLWREPVLAGDNDSLRVITKELRNPFDVTPTQVSRFADQFSRLIAGTGPMTAQGVCYQKIRAIVSVDARTGTPLWTRNDFEQGCTLFGDDKYVFVQPPLPASVAENDVNDVECTMLSAIDGHTLGKRRIPSPNRRWATQGRRILAWSSEMKEGKTNLRLFLYDPESETDIWSETFPEGSRGCLVDQDSVAVLQPDGRFVLRSLHGSDGGTEAKIDAVAGLRSIRLVTSRDQLWLLVNDADPGADESWRRKNFIPADGRIYSIDRATGKSLWPVPAQVRGYGMLSDQPSDLPTLWFLRYRPGTNTQFGPTSNSRVDILCLDRRTGSSIVAKNDVPSNLNQVEVNADVRKKEVSLLLPQAQYTLRFTSNPRPPSPPFQQLREGNKIDAAFERLGDFMESMKGALTPPGQRQDDLFK